MKLLKLGLITLSAGLVLGACSESGGEKEANPPTPVKDVQNTKQSKESETMESTTETSFVEDIPQQELLEYSVDWSDEWKGLKFSITEVMVGKFASPEKAEEFGSDGEGIVAVTFVVENTSESDMTTYPDQGVLVVNGQQIDANLFMSDSVGGDILSGVQKEGTVLFDIPKMESSDAVSNIRLKWNASDHETEDYDNMFKEFDISIDLK